MLLAVQNRLDGVVDAAQVRGLDLCHVASFVVAEVDDILEGVAPLVSYQLNVDAAAVNLFAQALQAEHLFFSFAGIHRALDAQMERFGSLFQLSQIVGHCGVVLVAKGLADGAVNVDVEDWVVALVGAQLEDAVTQPADILFELGAVAAQLCLDVVDQRVRQDGCALEDHLVGVLIAVVAGLGEDRNRFIGDGGAVLVGNNFAHQSLGRFGYRVQDCLGNAVTDGGMQSLAVNLDGFHHLGQLSEVVRFLANQSRFDVLVDDRDEVLSQEQRVTAARTGILNRRAVAPRDLAVLQHQHNRDGLAGLTDGFKARSNRGADVSGAVGNSSALDCFLVVKEETCTAWSAYYVYDFHGKNLPSLSFPQRAVPCPLRSLIKQ